MYLYKNKTFIESFKKPQLNIIAGRPAMGKTMLYLQPIVTQYLVCNKSEIWP